MIIASIKGFGPSLHSSKKDRTLKKTRLLIHQKIFRNPSCTSLMHTQMISGIKKIDFHLVPAIPQGPLGSSPLSSPLAIILKGFLNHVETFCSFIHYNYFKCKVFFSGIFQFKIILINRLFLPQFLQKHNQNTLTYNFYSTFIWFESKSNLQLQY